MAIVRIDDIHFYTAITESAQQCWAMKKWLKGNNVEFVSMHYTDDAQAAGVITALNTWWDNANITDFPILTYTEIHDDLSPSRYPRRYFTTLIDLAGSDFLEKYALGR